MKRNGIAYTKVAADVPTDSVLMRKIRAEIKRRGCTQANILRWALMQRYGVKGFAPADRLVST